MLYDGKHYGIDCDEVDFAKVKIGDTILGIYHMKYIVQGNVTEKRQEWRGNYRSTRTVITITPNSPVMGETTIRDGLILTPDNFHYVFAN